MDNVIFNVILSDSEKDKNQLLNVNTKDFGNDVGFVFANNIEFEKDSDKENSYFITKMNINCAVSKGASPDLTFLKVNRVSYSSYSDYAGKILVYHSDLAVQFKDKDKTLQEKISIEPGAVYYAKLYPTKNYNESDDHSITEQEKSDSDLGIKGIGPIKCGFVFHVK